MKEAILENPPRKGGDFSDPMIRRRRTIDRVAEKLIESSVMLGHDDEAIFYLARYRAAFPVEHERWVKARASPTDASSSAH